jgi:hypothetical protein
MINITITILWTIQNNKTCYEMTATSKLSLLSESVMVIQIGVHPAGEEPNQHVIHVASRVSHTTNIREVSTKLNLGPYSWDEVLAP